MVDFVCREDTILRPNQRQNGVSGGQHTRRKGAMGAIMYVWCSQLLAETTPETMSAAIREFIEAVLLALLVFFLIQVSVQNFRVEGSSMEPTLEDAEYLLVNKMVYQKIDMQRLAGLIPFWSVKQPDKRFVFHQPRRGDVIVFRYPLDPQRDFVKRVVGGPGDTVEIRRGTVYVNNVPLDEPYITQEQSSEFMGPRLLRQDEYFVLGDNRGASNDSRDWGPVPMKNIIGKVWVTYWPLSKLGLMSTTGWLSSLTASPPAR